MNRHQLNDLIASVAQVGLAGKSMQDKLASIVHSHDLTAEHIRRIAEGANRKVGELVTKQAHAAGTDPRVKFDLCDPEPLCHLARKTAEASLTAAPTDYEVLAYETDLAGGDPFAPPVSKTAEALPACLGNQPVDLGYLHDQAVNRTTDMVSRLESAYDQLKLAQGEANQESNAQVQTIHQAFDSACEAAIDMIQTGMTIPDLYMAIYASFGGQPEALAEADRFTRVLLGRLKELGIPNYRLGFHWPHDPDELESFGVDTLIALCRRTCGIEQEGLPLTRPAVKMSEANLDRLDPEAVKIADRYMEKTVQLFPAAKDKDLSNPEEANKWLLERDSVNAGPHLHLDQGYASNTPDGHVRTINGDSEFIISLNSIIGAKNRLVQLHGANEYLGLKMQELVDLIKGVKEDQANVTDRYERVMQGMNDPAKTAFIAPLLAAAGRAIAPAVAGAATKAVGGAASNSGPAKSAELTLGDALKLSAGMLGKAMGGLSKAWQGAGAGERLNMIASGIGASGAVAQPVMAHMLPARSEDVTKRQPGVGV